MTAEQLRNSILQEAISGRLVPQDPNDEPADALLARIREEKARLVKEGKLKKKDLEETPIAEDEMPFDIPSSWVWGRLKFFCSRFSTGPFGTMVHKEDYVENNGHNLINPTNIKQRKIIADGIKQVSEAKYKELNSYVLAFNDVVLARRGDLSKIAIVSKKEEGWLTGTGAFFMHFYDGIYLPYFIYLYTSPFCQNYLLQQSVGGTMDNLNQKLLADFIFPLPPLAEQQRIVAKLEELLPIVEQYGKAQKELDELNAALPARLRQSILQEAISGRLVPQDENDEPASALLDSVQKQREQLIKEKKVKAKDIASDPICDDEKPFELPAKWEFVRLNYVAIIARGGSPRPIKEYLTDSPDGLNWIKIGDTEKGGKYINQTRERIKPEGLKKSRMIHKGDFLLTNSMSFGRPYISNIDGCIHDGWLVISPAFGEVFDKNYLYYVLSSPYARDQFLGKVSGAVVQNLNSDKVATSIIPLPPLAEQQRIVAKIEELFTQIDKITK